MILNKPTYADPEEEAAYWVGFDDGERGASRKTDAALPNPYSRGYWDAHGLQPHVWVVISGDEEDNLEGVTVWRTRAAALAVVDPVDTAGLDRYDGGDGNISWTSDCRFINLTLEPLQG